MAPWCSGEAAIAFCRSRFFSHAALKLCGVGGLCLSQHSAHPSRGSRRQAGRPCTTAATPWQRAFGRSWRHHTSVFRQKEGAGEERGRGSPQKPKIHI